MSEISHRDHPACPCPQCKAACEQVNASHKEPETKEPARLKHLSPEAARRLGYIPAEE